MLASLPQLDRRLPWPSRSSPSSPCSFLGMGGYALAAPAALVRPFGITLGESASRSEVRAVYGGFGLAIAAVLAYAAVADGDLRKGILVTVGAALAGMAFGRLAA